MIIRTQVEDERLSIAARRSMARRWASVTRTIIAEVRRTEAPLIWGRRLRSFTTSKLVIVAPLSPVAIVYRLYPLAIHATEFHARLGDGCTPRNGPTTPREPAAYSILGDSMMTEREREEIEMCKKEIAALVFELAQCRKDAAESNAKVIRALDAAIQLISALLVWLPEGQPLPEGLALAKGALDLALKDIRR